MRPTLTAFGADILEMTKLAREGGCGPVGTDGKVLMWTEGRWTSVPKSEPPPNPDAFA